MSKSNKKKNKASLKKKNTRPKSSTPKTKKVVKTKNKTLGQLVAKVAILAFILFLTVAFCDYQGYFEPDATNNHTEKKWKAFYELTQKDYNVDILMIGNSHLYTGINPKTLSTALGVNSFILASPGTHVGDYYYTLKEALKETQPKVVVVETFGINDFNPYELENGPLSDQFKSFAARRNVGTKLLSTPFLFDSDNYFYAWSNTIRNHNYLFNNQAQIQKNRAKAKEKKKKDDKLYLGRYVRFQKGLQDSILNLYKTQGASIDGNEMTYEQSYAEHYVQKITELCQSKGIEVVFLTLPMYKDHVKDYSVWKKNLNTIISKYSDKWLDLQEGEGYKNFDKTSFENTYKKNQHMTYNGSLIATYKLRDYIVRHWPDLLPNREKEQAWIDRFSGEEGYYENYSPSPNGTENKMLASNVSTNGPVLSEIDFLSREKVNTVLVKIQKKPNAETLKKYKLRLTVQFTQKGEVKTSIIDLPYSITHRPDDYVIFSQNIKKEIQVLKVISAAFIQA